MAELETKKSLIDSIKEINESDFNIDVFVYSGLIAMVFGLMAAWNTVNEFLPFWANFWTWGRWPLFVCVAIEIVAAIFKLHRYCVVSLPMGLATGFIACYCIGYYLISLACIAIIVIMLHL